MDNNYYYGTPYYPPQQQGRASAMQQGYPQTPQQSGILWVQGEEAAKAYLVAAGNSVLLMDSEKQTFYLKSTDQSGMPLPLRVFDYAERAVAPIIGAHATQIPAGEFVTRAEFDALTAKIERLTQDKEGDNA